MEWAGWSEGFRAACHWAGAIIFLLKGIWVSHQLFVGYWHEGSEVGVNEHDPWVKARLARDGWFAEVGLDHVRVQVHSTFKNVTEPE